MVEALTRYSGKAVKWYERQSERWQGEQDIARRFLEEVTLGIDAKGQAFIRGTFPLRLNCGHELDRFQVRIEYPEQFPSRNCHPNVFLESHHAKWRAGNDSHIETTWRLCMHVALESGLNFERPGELEQLFPRLQAFLLCERFYQRDLKRLGDDARWSGPQRSHGDYGLLEAIKASGARLGRNDPCVCGSGKKYKKCHMERVRAAERHLRGIMRHR